MTLLSTYTPADLTRQRAIYQRFLALRPDSAKISQPVAAPSKMELAIEYLKNHPEDMQLTGRELEATRFPMGVKISYRTWNESKKPRAKT